MEISLILLVIFGIIVIAIGSALGRGNNKTTHNNYFGVEPQPFDAKTAGPLPYNTVLNGSAYVIDGDSLVIQKTQIRLFGVDAPEINHPYGQKAKWALVTLCKGQTVRAETIEKDDYGRVVAQCFLQDGRDLSAEMVKLGLAIDWAKFSGGKYRALEVVDIRRKLWLADARQKGRIHVWKQFEAKQSSRMTKE